MTDISEPLDAPPPRPLLKRLLPVLLPVLALAAGLGSTVTGLWSPLSMLHPAAPAPMEAQQPAAATFLDVPRLVLTLPGERTQTLALAITLEVEPASLSQARMLMPRITDSYNGFLSQIDAAAFSRRGILDILRGELATRTRFILGDTALRDLLITEFRIQ